MKKIAYIFLSIVYCISYADPNLLLNGYDINADIGLTIAHQSDLIKEHATSLSKFGVNFDVDTAGNEDIWSYGGNYTGFFATSQLMELVSTDPDDSENGTGMRRILVQGLDENYYMKEEIVTTNGTTPVNLTGSWIRVHRMVNIESGSTELNEGTINVRVQGGGAVAASIRQMQGQTLQAIYTIPNGYIGYLTKVWAEASTASPATAFSTVGQLRIRQNNGATGIRVIGVRSITRDHGVDVPLVPARGELPFRMDAKTDIWLHIDTCTTNDISVHGGFHIILVKNE